MRILITGGTGSLGRALTQHYLENTNDRVIVLSRDELKQAQMREEFPSDRLDFFLGDVRDLGRLELAFRADVDIVIHSAALKRVDATARDPWELVKTNIDGSTNVLRAASGRVSACLLVSTDKACHPSNAYGKSKAMAEEMFTTWNAYGIPSGTRSAVVRYGNVLGSRGSVVTRWSEQITKGLPLTLTHPEMTRFLITMPQAIQMIQTALTLMEGGEIFVPRLPSIRQIDMAAAMTEPEYPIKVEGMRPGGEKLHETLLTPEEAPRALQYEKHAVIWPDLTGWRLEPPKRPESPAQPEAWNSEWATKLSVEEIREVLKTL